MAFYDEWERTAVFFKIKTENGANKYVRAPFDYIRIGADFCVEPACGPGNDLARFVNQTVPAELTMESDEMLTSREEGFHNLKVLVLERQQMGDLNAEGWTGVHRFDYL